mmetsp:Transcript_4280/g.11092  ORF Transcript_4280/g.11092 Transcript_4280/m.11092 type:complete len:252 (+) Transcript_4280:750-1505(+)
MSRWRIDGTAQCPPVAAVPRGAHRIWPMAWYRMTVGSGVLTTVPRYRTTTNTPDAHSAPVSAHATPRARRGSIPIASSMNSPSEAAARGTLSTASTPRSATTGLGLSTNATPMRAPSAHSASVACHGSLRKTKASMALQTGAVCDSVAASPSGSREMAEKPPEMPPNPRHARKHRTRLCNGVTPSQSRQFVPLRMSIVMQPMSCIHPRSSMTWNGPIADSSVTVLTSSACMEKPNVDSRMHPSGGMRHRRG